MKTLIVTSFKSVKLNLMVKQPILEIFPSTSGLWQLGFQEGCGIILIYITGNLDLHPICHTFLTSLHLYKLGLYFEAVLCTRLEGNSSHRNPVFGLKAIKSHLTRAKFNVVHNTIL